MNPEATADENFIEMIHAIDNVSSGMVTYAVRNAKVDGFSLTKGDIIALDNKKYLRREKTFQKSRAILSKNFVITRTASSICIMAATLPKKRPSRFRRRLPQDTRNSTWNFLRRSADLLLYSFARINEDY